MSPRSCGDHFQLVHWPARLPSGDSRRLVTGRRDVRYSVLWVRCWRACESFSTPELLENCIASTSIFVLPSYKVPTVDALASTTDEGRGWLRKATGICLPRFDPWMSEWGNPAPVMGCHSGLNT